MLIMKVIFLSLPPFISQRLKGHVTSLVSLGKIVFRIILLLDFHAVQKETVINTFINLCLTFFLFCVAWILLSFGKKTATLLLLYGGHLSLVIYSCLRCFNSVEYRYWETSTLLLLFVLVSSLIYDNYLSRHGWPWICLHADFRSKPSFVWKQHMYSVWLRSQSHPLPKQKAI